MNRKKKTIAIGIMLVTFIFLMSACDKEKKIGTDKLGGWIENHIQNSGEKLDQHIEQSKENLDSMTIEE